MTKTEAIAKIDQALREDHTGYTFDLLSRRFEMGLVDALESEADTVTIKIPAGSEFTVPTDWVWRATN